MYEYDYGQAMETHTGSTVAELVEE